MPSLLGDVGGHDSPDSIEQFSLKYVPPKPKSRDAGTRLRAIETSVFDEDSAGLPCRNGAALPMAISKIRSKC